MDEFNPYAPPSVAISEQQIRTPATPDASSTAPESWPLHIIDASVSAMQLAGLALILEAALYTTSPPHPVVIACGLSPIIKLFTMPKNATVFARATRWLGTIAGLGIAAIFSLIYITHNY